MVKFFIFLWVIGLLTLVPYGTYYLFFEASREQYALLIVFILFWVFGYWGVAGPIISAVKVHSIMTALGNINSGDELRKLIQSEDSKQAAIDMIASENHIPRFMAKRIFNRLARHLSDKKDSGKSA